MKVVRRYENLLTGVVTEDTMEITKDHYAHGILMFTDHRFVTIATKRGGFVTYRRIEE